MASRVARKGSSWPGTCTGEWERQLEERGELEISTLLVIGRVTQSPGLTGPRGVAGGEGPTWMA